jgi:hypothetical protein
MENEDGAGEENPQWSLGSGRNADGSYTVMVRARVRVRDDVALRAAHLTDIAGVDMPPDLGTEFAIAQEVTMLLRGLHHPEVDLIRADIALGGTGASIQP